MELRDIDKLGLSYSFIRERVEEVVDNLLEYNLPLDLLSNQVSLDAALKTVENRHMERFSLGFSKGNHILGSLLKLNELTRETHYKSDELISYFTSKNYNNNITLN